MQNTQSIEVQFVPAVCEKCGEQLAQIATPKGSGKTSFTLKSGTHVCKPKDGKK